MSARVRTSSIPFCSNRAKPLAPQKEEVGNISRTLPWQILHRVRFSRSSASFQQNAPFAAPRRRHKTTATNGMNRELLLLINYDASEMKLPRALRPGRAMLHSMLHFLMPSYLVPFPLLVSLLRRSG